MPSWKDNWKTIYVTSDDWLRIKKDGSEVALEHVEEVGEYEDDEGMTQHKFRLYRFDIEQWKLVSDPANPQVERGNQTRTNPYQKKNDCHRRESLEVAKALHPTHYQRSNDES